MTDEIKIVQADKSDKRLTNNDFHLIFQVNPTGNAIFNYLYQMNVLNKSFDSDPYIHAFNAGRMSIVQEIANRCNDKLEKTVEDGPKVTRWTLEEPK